MPEDHSYESGHQTPKWKQQKVMTMLAAAGREGLTPREVAELLKPGDVSAMQEWAPCFTHLRQEGEIAGLKLQRKNHHVHVLKPYVLGRDTWTGYTHKGTRIVVVEKRVVIVKHCATCTCEENKDE